MKDHHLKMKKIWDTSAPSFDYPNNIKGVYEDIYINQRKSYTNWIGKISSRFRADLDWWISVVSSRNPYNSKLFHSICILESLKILKVNSKITKPKKNMFSSFTNRSTYIHTPDVNIDFDKSNRTISIQTNSFDDFDKYKRMRDVCTSCFHSVSHRDLCNVPENKGFCSTLVVSLNATG